MATRISHEESTRQVEVTVAWHYLYLQETPILEAKVTADDFIADAVLRITWMECYQKARAGEDYTLINQRGPPFSQALEILSDHMVVLTPSILARLEKTMRDNSSLHRTQLCVLDWLEQANDGDYDIPDLKRTLTEVATDFAIGEAIESEPYATVVGRAHDDFLDRSLDDRLLPAPIIGEHVRGFKFKKLYLVGGLTSNHKTTFALQSARACVKASHPMLYITLEDDNQEIVERVMAAESEFVTLDHFERGMQPNDGAVLHQELLTIRDSATGTPMYFSDRRLSLSKLIAAVSRMVPRLGLRMVVIDFMQLILPDNPQLGDTANQAIAVQALADLAKRLNIVIMAVVQLTQEATKRSEDGAPPRLGDIRGGSAISQAAYGTIFTHTPTRDPKDAFPANLPEGQRLIELRVAKWKRAPRRGFTCLVDAAHDRFSEYLG